MMKAYPPQEATIQNNASADMQDQSIDPYRLNQQMMPTVFAAFRQRYKEKIKAKIATASLSQDPADDLEIYDGTIAMNNAENIPASDFPVAS